MTRRQWLQDNGFYIGKRDPNRNRAFKGRYMVCANVNEGPSDDASTTDYCVVGDNLEQLIRDAYEHNCR